MRTEIVTGGLGSCNPHYVDGLAGKMDIYTGADGKGQNRHFLYTTSKGSSVHSDIGAQRGPLPSPTRFLTKSIRSLSTNPKKSETFCIRYPRTYVMYVDLMSTIVKK